MNTINPNQLDNGTSGVPGKKNQKKSLQQDNSSINVEESQGQLNSEQNDLQQISQSKPNTKQQTTQIQDKPKEANQKQNQKENQPAEIKPTQKQSEDNQQIEQQISIFKSKLLIPKRRNHNTGGSMGRATEIEVNHLPLNLDELYKKVVYHIDVQFKPNLPKKLLRNALEEFNYKNYPKINFAFDGQRNMYTTKEIKEKTDFVTVLNEENNSAVEFIIVTSVVNIIPMNKIKDYLKSGSSIYPLGEAFQALDIILKNRPFSLRFTNAGRSFFPVPRHTPVDLGEGMELWKGFFQTPVMGWKPYLNIDVAHKGFVKHQPLITYIKSELRCDLNSEMDRKNINKLLCYIKGLKVEFMIPMQTHTKRIFKVVGLLDSASKHKFEIEDPVKGNKILNVVQYYKIARNYVIKYPNLPCLHVGNINKKIAIPIELCIVQKGQVCLKKFSEMQTGAMVKNAARPPVERRQAIENSIRDIKFNQDPVLKEFGIEVKEEFASIPARVLDQPFLAYAQNREIKPKAGIWKAEKFSKPVHIKKWVVLNLEQKINIPCIKNFEKILMLSGKDLNVSINPMDPVINNFLPRNSRLDDLKTSLQNIFKKLKAHNIELIIVIIPDIPAGVYAIIKQKSELDVGILTQCIKSNTMFNMNKGTACNILMKINSKLNGINHTLSDKNRPPCMVGAIIFGADVTHPSEEQTSVPSVAAVAASHDVNGVQYNMEWRLQHPRVEIIQDLEDIIHKQLLKFKDKTKTVPRKIFYFRDGVSESQFLQLLEYELVAIRRACLRLNIHYKPSVTFLIVQKRHHTRMFPKYSYDMDGKFANVPSGTIVDTQITHPTEVDFYLCSHSSIQGTSRPTKYHLIWDENNMTEDQLEQLTFYLCFTFVRCTRSTSYPAPTYYAHLAAFRARSYIENKTININRLDDEQFKNKLNHSFSVETPMFFI